MRRSFRGVIMLVVAALVAASCGTTLDDEQAAREREKDLVAQGAGAGPQTAGGTVGGGGSDAGASPGSDPAAESAGSTTPQGDDTQSGEAAAPAEGGGQAGQPGPGGGGGGGGSGGGAGGAGGRNVSTGGATDVGVSETEIRLGWVGTLTGPQPGLFRGALIGTQAWANYQNSQGGLMGRKITVASGDDALDSGRNRAAHLNLKDRVFAFVGSFSINDDGGSSVIDQCACPDISGNLSPQMHNSAYHFGPQPAPLGWRSGPPKYYAQKYGKAVIEKLAFFYSQVGAAIPIAQEHRRVYEAAGFKVVYTRGVAPNDTNQTADVVQMRQAGVRAITFQGDLNAISRLANAMRQQNFVVDLLNLGNALYDSNTFKVTTPDALEGLEIDQVYGLFLGEDAARIPEVTLFNEWMKKTDPGQVVDLFALYGWLSGRLFADAMNKMADEGKTPVRKDLIDTLKAWGTWDGYGLVAPVDIGKKRPSDCFFIFTATADKKFKRTYPTGNKNFECGVGPFVFKP